MILPQWGNEAMQCSSTSSERTGKSLRLSSGWVMQTGIRWGCLTASGPTLHWFVWTHTGRGAESETQLVQVLLFFFVPFWFDYAWATAHNAHRQTHRRGPVECVCVCVCVSRLWTPRRSWGGGSWESERGEPLSPEEQGAEALHNNAPGWNQQNILSDVLGA